MNPACIITDSSAQFTWPSFPGKNLVFSIPLYVESQGERIPLDTFYGSMGASGVRFDLTNAHLVPPPDDIIYRVFEDAATQYHQVIGIFISSAICGFMQAVQSVLEYHRGSMPIPIVDSESTSIGLGLLVQAAAKELSNGSSMIDVERQSRGLISRLYTVICTPNLRSLYHNNFIDYPQALIGEMLGIHAILAIENGKPTPLDKARSYTQTYDYFQEFMDEFDHLDHIALLHSSSFISPEARALREHASEIYPKTPFTDYGMNPATSILFGKDCLGIVVEEGI